MNSKYSSDLSVMNQLPQFFTHSYCQKSFQKLSFNITLSTSTHERIPHAELLIKNSYQHGNQVQIQLLIQLMMFSLPVSKTLTR